MVNKYPGKCSICGGMVAARAGNLYRSPIGSNAWTVAHLACKANGKPAVHTYRFSSGQTFIRNARGRCEDAPCCGCCTI